MKGTYASSRSSRVRPCRLHTRLSNCPAIDLWIIILKLLSVLCWGASGGDVVIMEEWP